jgi:RND family efflux transporter MFP subunit
VRFVLFLLTPFIIIPFLVFQISCNRKAENEKVEKVGKVRVRTAGYQKTDYEFTLIFSGEVKAWKKVNMSFNVGGKIDRFYFDEGQKVKKGNLLAKLEQDDYRALRDQAHAQWEKTERDYKRSRRLWEEGSIREQLVQDAHTAFKTASAALDAVELNLKHCLLFAPFSGHVAFRFGEEKEMVAGGKIVFTLMDLSRIIIEVGVPEKNIEKIKKGQKANISLEAIPERIFPGKVTKVAVSSRPNIRLFKVEITAQNPDLIIKPGMTALSTIMTYKMRDAYIFSLDVAVLRNGIRVLYLALNGKAKEVTLRNYIISGDRIIVSDPLPENGKVITSGQDILFDDVQISIVEEEKSK